MILLRRHKSVQMQRWGCMLKRRTGLEAAAGETGGTALVAGLASIGRANRLELPSAPDPSRLRDVKLDIELPSLLKTEVSCISTSVQLYARKLPAQLWLAAWHGNGTLRSVWLRKEEGYASPSLLCQGILIGLIATAHCSISQRDSACTKLNLCRIW